MAHERMILVWVGALLLSGLAASAGGQEFRMENRVFVGKEEEPRTRSTTIFCGGVVYDYLDEPAEITVFDELRGRFVLLDLKRRLQTEVTADRLTQFIERLRRRQAGQSDAYAEFLANPKFETQYDPRSGELTLSSPWMTYRVETVDAKSSTVLGQYRAFCDWYARLNTLLSPGSKRLFARLTLNEALHARGRIPQCVHLTLRPKEGLLPKQHYLRSEHQLFHRLVESDRDRIAQTDQFMAMFQAVDFAEYQRKPGK